jgi:uncharacterized protein with ATP-grasp and redox domains
MIRSNDKTNRASTSGFTPHLECVACLVRQAHEAVVAAIPDAQLRETALRKVLQLLTRLDWCLSPPALAQQIHRLVRGVAHNSDPYAAVKEQLNHRAARLDPVWHRRLSELFPPFEAAVRLAIVGNLLDVGAKTQLGEDDLLAAFERALAAPLVGSVAGLADAIHKARHVLYLADNAGEIVFDRWLLAQLPLGKFTVVVRGAPVLNDATLADAQWAGLPDFCEVIANGSDAPGTVLEDCSPEFRARFEAADLIIAKGQGNYETLASVDKRIFFLLKVKCPVVAEALGCPCGSLVIHHQRPVGIKVKRTVTAGKVAAHQRRSTEFNS